MCAYSISSPRPSLPITRPPAPLRFVCAAFDPSPAVADPSPPLCAQVSNLNSVMGAALGGQVSIQNIPGLGTVQVISAQGLQQLLQQPGQTVHTLPGGAQIIGELLLLARVAARRVMVERLGE